MRAGRMKAEGGRMKGMSKSLISRQSSFVFHPSSFIPLKMVEAPRIELGSKSQRRGIYMLSRFSSLSGKPDKTSLNAE
jgi:hypothetical protein